MDRSKIKYGGKSNANTLQIEPTILSDITTKDAVMQENTFKVTYPNWEKFEAVREQYGAVGKFSSAQSKRLGLA